MIIDDDILNRYLDGELNDDEVKELEKALKSSPELSRKMNLLKVVDISLRNSAPESPSRGFTSAVMEKLRKKSHSKSQNYFFYFIFGFIALLSLGISVYAISALMGNPGESSYTAPDVSQYLNTFINDLTHFAAGLINPDYFSLLGSLISCILIITGYFFFENIKNLKKLSR